MEFFKFPIIKISLFFVLGIVFASHFNINSFSVFWVLGAVFIIFIIAFIRAQKKEYYSYFFGFVTLLFAAVLGMSTLVIHTEKNYKNHYINYLKNDVSNHVLEVSVSEKLKFNAFQDRFVIQVLSIDGKKVFQN